MWRADCMRDDCGSAVIRDQTGGVVHQANCALLTKPRSITLTSLTGRSVSGPLLCCFWAHQEAAAWYWGRPGGRARCLTVRQGERVCQEYKVVDVWPEDSSSTHFTLKKQFWSIRIMSPFNGLTRVGLSLPASGFHLIALNYSCFVYSFVSVFWWKRERMHSSSGELCTSPRQRESKALPTGGDKFTQQSGREGEREREGEAGESRCER